MELALAVLLISTLSTTGLLALWAATSPRHWFVRTAAFLAAASLLMLVPAEEMFAALVLQGWVVAAGVQAFRWRMRRASRANQSSYVSLLRWWRFSLLELILAFSLAAAAVPLARRVRYAEWLEWPSVFLGAVAGGVTLLAAWLLASAWRRRTRLLVAGASLTMMSAICWLVAPSQVESVLAHSGHLSEDVRTWPLLFWAGVLVGMCAMTVALAALWRRGCDATEAADASRTRIRLARVAGLLVATFPLYVLYQMATPLPIPEAKARRSDGCEFIVAAAKHLYCRPINYYAETPVAQYAPTVRQLSQAYDLVERGLELGYACHPSYTMDYDPARMERITSLRTTKTALAARARVALDEGRVDDAVADFERLLAVEFVCRDGGLMLEWLTACAIGGITRDEIWRARESLTISHCRRLIEKLRHIEESSEPFSDPSHRNRVWDEWATGPYGRLAVVLGDVAGAPGVADRVREQILPRLQAETRLLICELALHATRLATGEMPRAIEEFVAGFLPDVPVDPFTSDGVPLQYRRLNGGYVLYSVGPDCVDDGGTAPDRKLDDWYDRFRSGKASGDMTLDWLYEPR